MYQWRKYLVLNHIDKCWYFFHAADEHKCLHMLNVETAINNISERRSRLVIIGNKKQSIVDYALAFYTKKQPYVLRLTCSLLERCKWHIERKHTTKGVCHERLVVELHKSRRLVS